MARRPGGESSEADTTEVLTTALSDTLSPIAERHAAADLSTAANILADAFETPAREIPRGPSVLDEEASVSSLTAGQAIADGRAER